MTDCRVTVVRKQQRDQAMRMLTVLKYTGQLGIKEDRKAKAACYFDGCLNLQEELELIMSPL